MGIDSYLANPPTELRKVSPLRRSLSTEPRTSVVGLRGR